MSRGADLHEIFNSQDLDRNNNFQFHHQMSRKLVKLSKKTKVAPQPPGRTFSGYKANFSGEYSHFREVPQDLTSPSTSPKFTMETYPASDYDLYSITAMPRSTTPTSSFVADKGVPASPKVIALNCKLTLEKLEDENRADMDAESQTSQCNIYETIQNDDYDNCQDAPLEQSVTSKSVHSHDSTQWMNKHLPCSTTHSRHSEDAAPIATLTDDNLYLTANTGRRKSQNRNKLDKTFISNPVYGDHDLTMKLSYEDIADQTNNIYDVITTPGTLMPGAMVYEGEDLSRYLSDDESKQDDAVLQNEAKIKNALGRKEKPEKQWTKLSPNYSLFKKHTSGRSTRRHRREVAVPTFNSVRSFSYADSKFGTNGKFFSKSKSLSELTDDSELFLNASARHGSYESFLLSRLDETLTLQSNVGGAKMEEDCQNSRPSQTEDTLWKKLTVKLKHGIGKYVKNKAY